MNNSFIQETLVSFYNSLGNNLESKTKTMSVFYTHPDPQLHTHCNFTDNANSVGYLFYCYTEHLNKGDSAI